MVMDENERPGIPRDCKHPEQADWQILRMKGPAPDGWKAGNYFQYMKNENKLCDVMTRTTYKEYVDQENVSTDKAAKSTSTAKSIKLKGVCATKKSYSALPTSTVITAVESNVLNLDADYDSSLHLDSDNWIENNFTFDTGSSLIC